MWPNLKTCRTGLLVAGLLALAACDVPGLGEGRAPAGVTQADSGSVRILTDARDPGELPRIDLAAAEPDLILGEVTGEDPYLFSRVRGAVPLPGRGVAVADGQTARIRIFDAEGRFVRAFGGLGDGPGEFAHLSALGLLGPDTLFAWDQSRFHLTSFSLDGSVLGALIRPEVAGTWPPEAEPLSTTRALLVQHLVDPIRGGDLGIHPRTDSVALFLATPDGIADTIGRFAGRDLVFIRYEAVPGMTMNTNVPIPFGHETFARALGERILLARSDRAELRILDGEGRLEELWRYPNLAGPRTREAAEAAAARFEAVHRAPQAPAHFESLLEHTAGAERLPPFIDIRVTEEGSVWLAEFPAREGEGPTWRVLAPDGLLQTRVELPEGFRILHAGDEVVLGVVFDEWGVERVVRYEFEIGG